MARGTIAASSVILSACLLLGQAQAADAPPDRSTLSYDENVIINTVCFAAGQSGRSAYDTCVRGQIAALKAHPSPDRTSLSPARNEQIQHDCAYQRRVDIGEYNECLQSAMAKPAPKTDAEAAEFAPNVSNVFTSGPDRPAAEDIPLVALPLPSEVLPERPDHIDRQPLSPAEVFKKVERSVVVIYATRSLADGRAREIAQGSAVAVTSHLLLTNCHVVENRPVIRIMMKDTAIVATLAASDEKTDRCILKSEGPALVPIGGVRRFADLGVGERVFAVGTPAGLEHTLTEGIISSLRNFGARNLVQTDAPISHGNSGGGLFDESGNLIGITTLTLATRPGFQNLNFAIAASDYWEKKSGDHAAAADISTK